MKGLISVWLIKDFIVMSVKYTIQEIICHRNLLQSSCTRNNNSPCPKDANRNSLTLPITLTRPLSFTEISTATDTRRIVRIIEEFCIDALINCLFKHTEEIVSLN